MTAASEILHEQLPEWTRVIGSRRVKSARVPHLCGITGHVIEPGQSYTAVVHKLPVDIHNLQPVAVVCSCNSACWMPDAECWKRA